MVETTISGYLDIGIIDTMEDLFVNFFGAVIFSVMGISISNTARKVETASS